MPDPLPPRASPSPLRRAGRWVVVLGLLAYALVVWRHAGILPAGADSSGYFNQARLLSSGQVQVAARVLPGLPMLDAPGFAYVPLGFKPRATTDTLAPSYPSGLSLLLAGSAALAGWTHGPHLLFVLHALAGLAAVYALGRACGLEPPLATLGAVALACSPLYLQFCLQGMSDLPALVWSTAAIALACHGARRPAVAAAAGFMFSCAVLIRPTNLLLLPPLLLALGRPGRSWLALALGGAPGAGWLLALNHAAYGHPLATGYGSVGMLFGLAWVPAGLRHYAQWLPVLLTPLVLLILGLPFVRGVPGRIRLLLGSWIAGLLAFYAFYYHTHETWWYLRFVLPAFPPLIVGALLAGRHFLAGRPRWARPAAVATLALVVVNGIYWNRHWTVLAIGEQEKLYPRAAAWAGEHLPPDAVVVCMQASGTLFYHTDRALLRWDALDGRWEEIRDRARAAGRPIHAALFEFEVEPALRGKVPGSWTLLHTLERVSFWRLEPDP